MNRNVSVFLLGFLIVALIAFGQPGRPVRVFAGDDRRSDSDNWAQWRGPSGQGYSDDKRVPLEWSQDKNLVWKTRLPGQGNSSPIVWGDRIFLTASSLDGKERSVLCVHSTDGKILWQHLAAKEKDPGKTHGWNGYASASCATDGRY